MDITTYRDIRWLPYRNDAGETIPAYALLRITGVESLGTSPDVQTLYVAAKPSASATHLVWAFNDGSSIASGGYGLLTFDFPAVAKVNTGAAPVNSETWGPSSGQWYIVKSDTATMPLVVIHGKTTEQGDTTIVERYQVGRMGVGQAAATIGAGSAGSVTLYKWVAGVWTTMSVSETMRNTTGTSVSSGKKVSWFYHQESAQYLFAPLECG